MTRTAASSALTRYQFLRADAVMVSFPKCGRTWLRLMVGRVLADHLGLAVTDPEALMDLWNLTRSARDVPTVTVTHDDGPQFKEASEVERSKRRYRHKDVVLVVRDPRDVMVSLYFQMSKRRHLFEGSLDEFLDRPVGGPGAFVAFYNAWADARDEVGRLLVVRYEDMHADAGSEVRRVLDFLRVPASPEAVERAVEASTFERMRAMEAQGQGRSMRLKPGEADDPESYKVRRGEVAGFRRYLSDQQVARFDRWLGELSPLYGYGVAGDAVSDPAGERPPG